MTDEVFNEWAMQVLEELVNCRKQWRDTEWAPVCQTPGDMWREWAWMVVQMELTNNQILERIKDEEGE